MWKPCWSAPTSLGHCSTFWAFWRLFEIFEIGCCLQGSLARRVIGEERGAFHTRRAQSRCFSFYSSKLGLFLKPFLHDNDIYIWLIWIHIFPGSVSLGRLMQVASNELIDLEWYRHISPNVWRSINRYCTTGFCGDCRSCDRCSFGILRLRLNFKKMQIYNFLCSGTFYFPGQIMGATMEEPSWRRGGEITPGEVIRKAKSKEC